MTAEIETYLAQPTGPARGAVLVLSGSSGRVMRDRCDALAAHGYAALSPRYFGAPPAPESLTEVPIESFLPLLDRLEALGAPGLAVMGTSFGGVAALLLGIADPRLSAVVALAPSHLVWATPTFTEDGRPVELSAFSWRGDPLHFMPVVDQTRWRGPEFADPRQLYEASLRSFPARVAAATIDVEEISADLIVTGGGDDRVWPSAAFADEIATRRRAYGLDTTVLIEPGAGHRLVLPGETPAESVADYSYGGQLEADRRLGERVLAALDASLPLSGD